MLNRSAAQRELLGKGIGSYPKALEAIREFERLIQEGCRHAAEAALRDICEGLSTHLTFVEAYQDSPKVGVSCSVGVRFKDDDRRSHNFYAWWTTGGVCNVVASVEFGDKKTAGVAVNCLRRAATTERVEVEDYEVYTWRRIAVDAESLEEALEGVLHDWARLWKSAGGMHKLAADAGAS